MSDLQPLPDGWRWVTLGDVTKIHTGTTPSRSRPEFFGTGIQWVTPGDFDGSIYLSKGREEISPLGLSEGKAKIFPPRSVLMVCIGATIGKVAIAETEISANQQINALVCSTEIWSEFLYFSLLHNKPSIIRSAKSSTLPIINQERLGLVSIPLPPLAEQQRIAAILAEQMADIEAARRAAEAELEAAESLTAAYLRSVFESDEAQEWGRVKLGDLAIEEIRNGAFKRRHEFGGGVPFVNVADLFNSLVVNITTVERVSCNESEMLRFRLEEGDLLFCRSSVKREGIGHLAIIRDLPEPSIFDCHIMRLRVDLNLVLPEFVAYYCLQSDVRANIVESAKTQTMTTMSQGDLAGIGIVLPPFAQQQRIAAILDEQMTHIDSVRRTIESQIEMINTLPAAVLRHAFSGQL